MKRSEVQNSVKKSREVAANRRKARLIEDPLPPSGSVWSSSAVQVVGKRGKPKKRVLSIGSAFRG